MEPVIQYVQPNFQTTEVGSEEKAQMAGLAAPLTQGALPKAEKPISLKQLINKLNLLNFRNSSLFLVFKHRAFPRTLTLRALPLPCQDEHLACRWTEPVDLHQLSQAYRFDCLQVPNGQRILEVKPEITHIDPQQIDLLLPQECRETGERKRHRHPCVAVSVHLFQNGAAFFGRLIDFCAFQFRVTVDTTIEAQTFGWIDEQEPVTLIFTKGQQTLFSGDCRIIKHTHGRQRGDLVLEPLKRHFHRFKSRQFRSTRQKLSPSPNVVFEHPLFSTTINLKIFDISGSGFSVEEKPHSAVFLPGMIIPDLELIFSDGSALRCMAQVVYSNVISDSAGDLVRCGLAFLDVHVEDHLRLLALLQQIGDANAYVGCKVDLQALWEFFFETGFIYPQKYRFIATNKEAIKATYQKLYNQRSGIASHFIYQENGRILAHMAMVRFYEKAWLIHHHAAIRSSLNLAGLIVLNQVGRFINDCHRFPSMKMEYVFCYYQPENKFPAHVFGGAARNINDPDICSVDCFAYYHHLQSSTPPTDLPNEWRIKPADEDDLYDLKTFYDKISGGLMLRGLHLEPGMTDCADLISTYHQLDLKRERYLFALYRHDSLCAILVANLADLGLNMSDLTNSVTIFVVNEAHLTADLLNRATETISRYYKHQEIPVLLFPRQAAAKIGVDSEKSYCLWVYNTQNLDYYFRYLKRILKFVQH